MYRNSFGAGPGPLLLPNPLAALMIGNSSATGRGDLEGDVSIPGSYWSIKNGAYF
jgi:hypothetical protein